MEVVRRLPDQCLHATFGRRRLGLSAASATMTRIGLAAGRVARLKPESRRRILIEQVPFSDMPPQHRVGAENPSTKLRRPSSTR
jgi:hypothetical protein